MDSLIVIAIFVAVFFLGRLYQKRKDNNKPCHGCGNKPKYYKDGWRIYRK